MGYLALFVGAIFALLVYFSDAWAQTHGLVVQSGDQWVLVASGWQVASSFIGFFLASGGVAGGLLGWLAGSRFWRMFQEISDAEIEEQKQVLNEALDKTQQERVALRKERNSLADDILVAISQAREQAFSFFDQERRSLQAHLTTERDARRQLEAQVKQLDVELEGARGKIRRLEAKIRRSTADEPFWGETGSGPVR